MKIGFVGRDQPSILSLAPRGRCDLRSYLRFEHRRWVDSSLFGPEKWFEDRTEDEGGCDFFVDAGGSSIFRVRRTKNLSCTIFGAGRTKNLSPSSTFSAERTKNHRSSSSNLPNQRSPHLLRDHLQTDLPAQESIFDPIFGFEDRRRGRLFDLRCSKNEDGEKVFRYSGPKIED